MQLPILFIFLSQGFRPLAAGFFLFFSAVYIYRQKTRFCRFFSFLVLYISKMFGVVFAEHLSFQSDLKTQMILGYF